MRILETVLVAKDVKSLVDARSASQEVLRSEVVPIMGEITGRDIDEKLRVAEFFVKAFALVGDIEVNSCFFEFFHIVCQIKCEHLVSCTAL